ncbi:hypothetical protein WDU94_000548, partial [Cyamophila willieti]
TFVIHVKILFYENIFPIEFLNKKKGWKDIGKRRLRDKAEEEFRLIEVRYLNTYYRFKRTKLRILNTYVNSILTYACESWTIDNILRNKITAFENWCYRRILRVSWTEKVTNKEILRRVGKNSFDLIKTIKKRKMAYAGHVMRGSSGDFMLRTLEGKIEGKRPRGRKRRKWIDDIKEWTKIKTYGECKRFAEDREKWKNVIRNI